MQSTVLLETAPGPHALRGREYVREFQRERSARGRGPRDRGLWAELEQLNLGACASPQGPRREGDCWCASTGHTGTRGMF